MTAPAPEVEIVRPVHDELATRPRYTPGIRAYQRAVDEIQIGVNPRRAVLATDLSPRMVSVLLSLDGQASIGRLMSRVGPSNAVSVTFLIPLFAILWGAIFLGEAVTTQMVIGGGVVLVGIALALGLVGPKPR